MSVIEITSLRLKGIVDDYLEACANINKFSQTHSSEIFDEISEPELIKDPKIDNINKRCIDNIQKTINLQFPWKEFDIPKPSVPRDGIMGLQTKKALDKIKSLATEMQNKTALVALKKIETGNFCDGASELWDAAREIEQILKTDQKYFEETGEDIKWGFKQKASYLNIGKYPIYFPKPWQAKNMCSFVGGTDDKHGKFTKIPNTAAEFRTCQTPKFNHFMMWGPSCPSCGIGGSDPRALRLKSKYPEAFTYEKTKYRMENQLWYPIIPSPGFKPYVAAPPEGTPYYIDPRNPDSEVEGVRFFDAEDEKLYHQYLEKYHEYVKEFGSDAEEYNQRFFEMMPHKKTVSPNISPNEWSETSYGKQDMLWQPGTIRPPVDEIKKRIQKGGLDEALASLLNGPLRHK